MIYEIRVYEAQEGRAEAMRTRFREEVVPRLASHGIELLGVFSSPAEDGSLTYITRFGDEQSRQQAWASFGSDAGWKAAKAASEKSGPLLKAQTVTVLTPSVDGLLLG